MPIYEFVCPECGAEFEKLCSMSVDYSEIVCKECDSTGVERKLSGFYSSAKESSKSSAPSAPVKTGGCGGGCACHH